MPPLPSHSLLPPGASFTARQAARALNVSRAHVLALLERGALPYEQVGRQRRIRRADLADYASAQAQQREQQLQLLADQAQELQLGYE